VYQEICESFEPSENWQILPTPIKLSRSSIKSKVKLPDEKIEKCWQVIKDLTNNGKLDFFQNNGFKVKLESKQLLLTEIFSKIPQYGFCDCIELLYLVSNHGIQKRVRPKKLKKYILELTRDHCASLNLENLSNAELIELLQKCSRYTCPHGHPIFEQIYDLNDTDQMIPKESQASQTTSQASQNT